MIKLIHTADLHLGKNFSKSILDTDLSQQRKKALWNTLENILSFTKNNSAILLFCGDLFDHFPKDYEIIRFLYMIKNYPHAKIFFTEGNHDQGLARYLEKFEGEVDNLFLFPTYNLTYHELPEFQTRVYGCSWNNNMDITEVLQSAELDSSFFNILLLHTSLEESSDAYLPLRLKTLVDLGFDYYALGHVHQAKKIKENIIFPGTPEPLSFRELGQHGIFMGSVDKDHYEMNFIQMSKIEFHQESVELNASMSLPDIERSIRQVLEKYNKNHFLKLYLKGYLSYEVISFFMHWIDDFAENMNNSEKIGYLEIINDTSMDFDLKELKKSYSKGIVGSFIEQVEQSDSVNKKEVLSLGLDALLGE